MVCAFYRGGYGYCFNATPHHCAHHQRCGQSPPQGHPNTTLLGFRVALRRRAGLKNYMLGATCHPAMKLVAAGKRNMRQRLQDGFMLSIVRWHELASGTPGPPVLAQVVQEPVARNSIGREQAGAKKGEARKRPGRDQGEARQRPGRGQEEARKRPGRGQEEDRKRTGRGRKTSGAAGGLPARPAGFRTLRKPSGRAGRGRKRYGKRGRQSCDPLLAKLAYLRKNRPMGAEGDRFVRDVCRKHKAWSGHHEPTNLDIEDLLQKTGNATTVITCTRKGAAWVNQLAVEVLFELPGAAKLGTVPADFESNPENYTPAGGLKDQQPEPLGLTLYEGLRVRLTRNINKARDYVNGMTAMVQRYDRRSGAVIVQTETGNTLCIYPVTTDDVPHGRVTYYPLKPGYADTVHKFQGAELPHVTFWPDRPGCPAAAYVALSRVKRDEDYLLGGCVAAEHFVPAK